MIYVDQTFDLRTVLCNNPGVPERVQTTARVRVAKPDARTWRVQLGALNFIDFPVDPLFGPPVQTLARVTWGVDGVNHEAFVDWPAGGGSFVVSGDFVQVDLVVPAAFVTDPAVSPPLATTAVQGGATIVPDSGAPASAPTRTLWTDFLLPLAFVELRVPAYARAFRWHQVSYTDPTVTAATVAFYGVQDPTLGLYSTQNTVFAPTTMAYTQSERSWPGPEGITLVPLTRFLYVENRSPLFVMALNIEFVLDLV